MFFLSRKENACLDVAGYPCFFSTRRGAIHGAWNYILVEMKKIESKTETDVSDAMVSVWQPDCGCRQRDT